MQTPSEIKIIKYRILGFTEEGEGTGKSRQPNPCLRIPALRCGDVCLGLLPYVGDTKV